MCCHGDHLSRGRPTLLDYTITIYIILVHPCGRRSRGGTGRLHYRAQFTAGDITTGNAAKVMATIPRLFSAEPIATSPPANPS